MIGFCSGLTDTPLTKLAGSPAGSPPPIPNSLNKTAAPAEIAKTIVFLLSDDSSFTTGSIYTIDGGWVC